MEACKDDPFSSDVRFVTRSGCAFVVVLINVAAFFGWLVGLQIRVGRVWGLFVGWVWGKTKHHLWVWQSDKIIYNCWCQLH